MASGDRVQVLLSVRDGAAYLGAQLDSLAAQTDVDVDVMVRDDGSQDSSASVVAAFADRVPMTVTGDPVPLGMPATYLHLLGRVSADRDFYAFCDQDDVWAAEKLALATSALTSLSADGQPALWVCAAAPFDDHGPLQAPGRTSDPCLGNALVESVGPGCCMVWNRALMQRLVVPAADSAVLHDSWLYASATILGQVLVEPRPLVRYRVHEHNTIGIDTRLATRIHRHRTAPASGAPTWEGLAAAVLAAYGPQLSADQRHLAVAMASGDRSARLRAWLRHDIRRSSPGDNLQLLVRLMWLGPRSAPPATPPV